MHIETLISKSDSAEQMLARIDTLRPGERPSVVFIHFDCSEDANSLRLVANAQSDQVHGATSCLGAMTQDGHTTRSDGGAAAFVIYDAEGDYGSACEAISDDPAEAGRAATRAALEEAGRTGEAPALIWLSTTPGSEEDVLRGITEIVGPDVPIIGGSAADNAVAGDWKMFDQGKVATAGVLVSVLFPSTEVAFAYQNGYAPAASQGVVTKAEGRRIIEIDNAPAAEVYANWTGGTFLQGAPAEDQNILADATLWPLGREIEAFNGVSQYLLAHPAVAHPDGSIALFADVAEGEVLTQMTGDARALAARAGRVAAMAPGEEVAKDDIAGALMVYCGGCMLAVRDYMDDVVSGLQTALPGVPLLGTFTFGEQGPILDAGNRHGNLMISCIVFGRSPA